MSISHSVKDSLDATRRQILDHKITEAKQNSLTNEERRNYLLDKSNPINATFPWLCAAFVTELVGEEMVDSVIPPGILNCVYLYKFMEQLSTGKGFRTFLGVMRRNDLWCNIRTYKFGELKNTSYLAHKEARALAMTSGSRFYDKLITCFKTMAGFYIVTGHVKSTPLHNFIKCMERFNDKELRFYAEELVCAVEFLHSRGIIHRDLSAANIKLTAEGHVKVFNLNNAYIAIDEEGRRIKKPEVGGMVGVDAYMPPEMIEQKLYGYTVDWWSLGVVLYFMMNGKMPFRGSTRRELFQSISSQSPQFNVGLHRDLTHDFVRSLLEKKQERRLGSRGAREVLRHKYFQGTDWDRVLNSLNSPPFLPQTSRVTSLPSDLCASLEHLDDSEPVKKSISRKEVQLQQSQSIAPDEFYEFELEHDWTTYLHPDIPIESAIHYVHGELKPPAQDDDILPLEECITTVPELSPEEKITFQRYIDEAAPTGVTRDPYELGSGKFIMLSPLESEIIEPDTSSYLDRFHATSESSLSFYSRSADGHEARSQSFKSELLPMDTSSFLKPPDVMTVSSNKSFISAASSANTQLKEKIMFWKRNHKNDADHKKKGGGGKPDQHE